MTEPCRLCLQYSDHYEDASKGKIHNLIYELFSFRIISGDESTIVCSECINIIDNFHIFYKQVKKIQKKFAKNSSITDQQNVLHIKEEINNQFYDAKEINTDNDESFHDIEEYPIKDEGEYFPDGIESNHSDSSDSHANKISKSNRIKLKVNKKIRKSNHYLKKKAKISSNVSSTGIDDQSYCDKTDAKVDVDDEFPSEIFKNGELILKGPSLNNLLKKFYNIQCDICKSGQSTFTKLSDLFRHYETIHKIKGYVSCCNTRLYHRRTICMHMARHIQPSAFECPICKKPVSRPNTLKLHLQTHLPDAEKPHKCDQCDKTYSCVAGLTRHKLTHIPVEERTVYKCKICEKVFYLSTSYACHMATIHSNIKFLCSECGRSFQTKTNLTFHMMTHDPTGKNKAECTICGFVCKNKQSLQRHTKIHSSKRFHCTQCDFSSHLQQRLNLHLRVKHSDVKPYVCTVCGKQFKIKNVLTAHMAQHTGERKFVCSFCPKTFASSGNYYTHRKRMHGDLFSHNETSAKHLITTQSVKTNENEAAQNETHLHNPNVQQAFCT